MGGRVAVGPPETPSSPHQVHAHQSPSVLPQLWSCVADHAQELCAAIRRRAAEVGWSLPFKGGAPA